MPRRQRGIALLVLVAMLVLSASWLVVSTLNASTTPAVAVRAHNARVLQEAKLALIGHVAAQAAQTTENYPGRLPCPEHEWYIGDPNKEGMAGPSVGVTNPGYGSSACATAGRLPWKTIGIDNLRDASGEPLWYVVSTGSTGWALLNSSTVLSINSDKAGTFALDGQANAVIAAIIAPGPALTLSPNASQIAQGCTNRSQSRGATPPNYLDYLECQNIAGASLRSEIVDNSANPVFNDQIITITVADLMPAVEAVVAMRIERDIVPALQSAYANADGATKWGTSRTSSSRPIYPFAAPFSDPDSSTYQGAASTYRGLLPFSYSDCTPGTDPRCSTTFNTWSATVTKTAGTASYTPDTCVTIGSPYSYQCTGWWYGTQPSNTATMRYEDRISNVGNALRTFTLGDYNAAVRYYNYQTGNWTSVSPTRTRTFNSDGSFSFVLTYTFPNVNGWGYFEFKSSRPVFSDHALLDSGDSTTGWFVGNEWHKLVYYAVAQGHTGTSTPSCTTSSNCITVANVAPSGAQRAILILAGRSVNGSARPSAVLSNYLESGNATGSFVKQTVTTSTGSAFNDRIAVVDSN